MLSGGAGYVTIASSNLEVRGNRWLKTSMTLAHAYSASFPSGLVFPSGNVETLCVGMKPGQGHYATNGEGSYGE
jgi:hypothetical protein